MKIHLQHIIDAALLLALCPLIAASQPGRWAEPVNISQNEGGSGYQDMAIGHDRKINVVWEDGSRLNGSTWMDDILYTCYNGTEWLEPVQISSFDTTYSAFPRIDIDSRGHPHVVWNHRAIFPDADIYYTTLTDTGWLEPINLSDHPSTSRAPDIAIDSEDNIHVVWSDHLYGYPDLFQRVYNGEEWLPFEVICYDQYYYGSIRLVFDSQDNLHLACGQSNLYTNANEVVYFEYDGLSWTPFQNISQNDSLSSLNPEIALDQYGNPHIVWSQITQWGPLPVIEEIFHSYFDGENWSEPENITNLGLRTADWPQLAISSQDVKYMLFSLSSQFGDLNVVFTIAEDSSWSLPDTLTEEYITTMSSIAIDDNDVIHAIISFIVVLGNSDLAYTHYEQYNSVGDNNYRLPSNYATIYAYPNPFNQSTKILYSIPIKSELNLSIYNIYGQSIKELENSILPAGEYYNYWNGTNQHGKELSAGVYFIRLHMNGESLVRKMIFIK
ncbi:MAG: T9SS type A sorting domain-containing protein [FCB group bacterium]|nr:T9SS type A sorting domain-containing protein [FCB group bacterium]